MKKTLPLIMASAAALTVLGGAAYAQAPERPDRNADVTRAQAEQRAVAAFERMDANKDGGFDAADREALKAQRSERRAERQEARFDRLDADKDGSITRAEFTAAHDQAREKFSERAKDGKRFGKRGGHRGFRMGGFGGGPKAGGDKTVTQAEFVAAALDRFDRTDANKDGTVTAAERREAFKNFRQQRQAAKQS